MEFLKLPTAKNSFSYTRLFIYLAIVLTNFSYLPVFVNSFGNKATVILWTVLIIFLFFRFLVYERKISPRFVFAILIFGAIIIFSCLQYLLISRASFSIRAFRSLIISFFIMCAGMLASPLFKSEKDIRRILVTFSFSCLIMGLYVFFAYLINSNVTGKSYAYQDGKNEISVLFFSASLFFLLRKKNRKFLYIIDFLIFSFFVLTVFFLRCRAVLVAYSVPFLFVIFSKNKEFNCYRTILIGITCFMCLIIFTVPFIREYFFKSLISFGRDSATLDSFATGRFEELAIGLNKLSKNPLFGIGKQKVEMFYGSIIVQYGFIFAIPIFIFALFPLLPLGRYSFSDLSFSNSYITLLGISFLLLGFFEELMPIGPGVRTYILWFLVGINYFKINYSFKYENNFANYEVVNV